MLISNSFKPLQIFYPIATLLPLVSLIFLQPYYLRPLFDASILSLNQLLRRIFKYLRHFFGFAKKLKGSSKQIIHAKELKKDFLKGLCEKTGNSEKIGYFESLSSQGLNKRRRSRWEGSEDLIHSTPRNYRFTYSIVWFGGVLFSCFEVFCVFFFSCNPPQRLVMVIDVMRSFQRRLL